MKMISFTFVIMEPFFEFIESNDLAEMNRLLGNGADINAKDKYHYSGLHLATANGLTEMALLLISSGIDVNLKDKNGQTVLHYAALDNLIDIARAALARGADLSIQDIHGNQPLWTAVFNDKGRNQRVEMISLFIDHGADVHHKNRVGKSPKDIVSIAGYTNLSFLLE
jgi:ankyrin repeat protein